MKYICSSRFGSCPTPPYRRLLRPLQLAIDAPLRRCRRLGGSPGNPRQAKEQPTRAPPRPPITPMPFARTQIDGIFVALAEVGADVVAQTRLVAGRTPEALGIAAQVDIGIEVMVAQNAGART